MIHVKILWRLLLITTVITVISARGPSLDPRQGRNSKLMDFEELNTDSAPTLPLFEEDDLINEGLLKEVMSDLSNHQEDRGGKDHEDKIALQHTWNLDQDYEILSSGNTHKNDNGSPRSGLPRQSSQGTGRQQGLLNNFGIEMGDALNSENDNSGFQTFPQLSSSSDGNFQADGASTRQEAEEEKDEDPLDEDKKEDEDEMRCIDKVIQVEETVYDEKVKCYHTFTEKCHESFITDYIPTQEKKCETSFKKNCHITYKPMMFEETIKICNQPITKVCNDDTVGEEICKTHYETNCETRYKEHQVEQDEPVCTMVEEKRCKDVRVPVPGTSSFRHQRQIGDSPLLQNTDIVANAEDGAETATEDAHSAEHHAIKQELSIGEECELWPVQKCTLEKKTVKKVHPETSCRKMPREICAPSNCEFKSADEVCHDEDRSLIQNIPSEDCNLQPQENCKMETVLVPRLIQQPNCIKVPKEICVNAKTNPRKIKKPVVKQWCYKPSDLKTPQTRLALSQFFNN